MSSTNGEGKVRLWIDHSRVADNLAESFHLQGFEVQRFSTGATKPCADYQGHFISGYAQIQMSFFLK